MNIGENLKNLRISKNLTQVELAEMLGLSQCFISRVESNTKNLSVGQVYEIAKVLECSTDEIILGKKTINFERKN